MERVYLGFDVGMYRIGVSVGQSVSKTAKPIAIVLANNWTPSNWQDVQKIIETWNPDAFVVGFPLGKSGEENFNTQKVKRFANRLRGRFLKDVFFQDERYTSFEARITAQDKFVDDVAAAIILEDYLNK